MSDAVPLGVWRVLRVFRHGRMRTPEEMRALLAAAGFRRFRRIPVASMRGVVAVLLATR